MLAISSDFHDDNALFCLPLFFVRVPAISAFGRSLFGLLGRRCSYSGLSPSASNCQLHSVGGSSQGARIRTSRSSSVGTDQSLH
jgi:hypothetical protein